MTYVCAGWEGGTRYSCKAHNDISFFTGAPGIHSIFFEAVVKNFMKEKRLQVLRSLLEKINRAQPNSSTPLPEDVWWHRLSLLASSSAQTHYHQDWVPAERQRMTKPKEPSPRHSGLIPAPPTAAGCQRKYFLAIFTGVTVVGEASVKSADTKVCTMWGALRRSEQSFWQNVRNQIRSPSTLGVGRPVSNSLGFQIPAITLKSNLMPLPSCIIENREKNKIPGWFNLMIHL